MQPVPGADIHWSSQLSHLVLRTTVCTSDLRPFTSDLRLLTSVVRPETFSDRDHPRAPAKDPVP